MPVRNENDACDEDGLWDRCADGNSLSACEDSHTCQNIFPPRIVEATAHWNPESRGVGISVTGEDPDNDVVNFSILLTAEDGTELFSGIAEFSPFEQADGAFSGGWSGQFRENPPSPPASATITILDAQGLESETLQLDMLPPAAAALGGECDLALARNVCPAPELACESNDLGQGVCVEVSPPTITVGAVYYDQDTGGVGITASGTDLDDDVIGFRIQLLDAEGINVISPDAEDLRVFNFQTFIQANGEYGGSISFRYDALINRVDPPALVSARLVIVDTHALESEPLLVDLEAPPVVAQGTPCDAVGGLNRCEGNLVCIDLDEADEIGTVCEANQVACPVEWPEAPNLNDRPEGDGWSLVDESAEVGLLQGSCGGGNGTRIFTFTAPASSYYRFSLSGSGSKTLSVRTACTQPDTELSCTRDFEEGTLESALNLEAGQTVYIFTDRFFADDPVAEFTLTVSFHQTQRVLGAEAYLNRQAGSMSIVVDGLRGSSDPSLVEADVLDAEGVRISLDPIRNPFRARGYYSG